MKAKPGKCHLLLSKNRNFEVNLKENRISNTIFGVTFDNRLNFNHHLSISNIGKTVGNKLHALATVSSYMDQDKREYFLFHTS